jgi:hypothetical protein
MMELLTESAASARHLDHSGERPLKMAKEMRRRVMREAGRRDTAELQQAANEHFGLPSRALAFWSKIPKKLPWGAPEGSAPSPRHLVSGER